MMQVLTIRSVASLRGNSTGQGDWWGNGSICHMKVKSHAGNLTEESQRQGETHEPEP